MKTWNELWEQELAAPAPKSSPSKARCSKLSYLMGCTDFSSSSSAGFAATRGKCLHRCLEKGFTPEEMPDEDYYMLKYARNAVTAIKDQGWDIYGVEMFFENERLTGNLDMVFINKKDPLHYLYIDAKFGYVRVDADSEQLAGGAELIYTTKGANSVTTGIIQPYCLDWGMDLSLYNWEKESCLNVVSRCLDYKKEINQNCHYCDHFIKCDARLASSRRLMLCAK